MTLENKGGQVDPNAPSVPPVALRDFLMLPYDELEAMNLKVKEQRVSRIAVDAAREERLRYLTDEKRIKAVTVCFTDLEGRLHMLDYDKKFLLKSADNLTFDGDPRPLAGPLNLELSP